MVIKEDCLFCNNEFKYAEIKLYDNWSLQLFVNDQYYIGRSVIVLRGRHIIDITELNIEERKELFKNVLPDLKNAIDELFNPDMYNYSSIGNDCEHFHIHVIPRYKTKRKFDGDVFEDKFFNGTYSQDYERIKLSNKKIQKLKQNIKSNII